MAGYDTHTHNRHTIRLPGYDYSQAGAYYVTTVTQNRECLFGGVAHAEMQLTRYGEIVQDVWRQLPRHYQHLQLDAFSIMPNHVHMILVLDDREDGKRQPLSEIVRAFKSFSARQINVARKTPGYPVWQRNYYEHIIRNQDDYLAIAAYIQDNPLNWENDSEHPSP